MTVEFGSLQANFHLYGSLWLNSAAAEHSAPFILAGSASILWGRPLLPHTTKLCCCHQADLLHKLGLVWHSLSTSPFLPLLHREREGGVTMEQPFLYCKMPLSLAQDHAEMKGDKWKNLARLFYCKFPPFVSSASAQLWAWGGRQGHALLKENLLCHKMPTPCAEFKLAATELSFGDGIVRSAHWECRGAAWWQHSLPGSSPIRIESRCMNWKQNWKQNWTQMNKNVMHPRVPFDPNYVSNQMYWIKGAIHTSTSNYMAKK